MFLLQALSGYSRPAGAVSVLREKIGSRPCFQAGLLTLVLAEMWLPLTADCYRSLLQVRYTSTSVLKVAAQTGLALLLNYNQ